MSLGYISRRLTVDSTKYHVFVFVPFSSILENWFEPHARPARLRPKVNNNSLVVFYNFRQVRLILYCDYFSKFRRLVSNLSDFRHRLLLLANVAKLIHHS